MWISASSDPVNRIFFHFLPENGKIVQICDCQFCIFTVQ
jgi:hypothetical protein